MADFYPVLKRAIGALPSNTGEARRAVYERARSALVRQLQAYDPPLSPAQITDQRLALEESIRRVESEVAGAAFGLTPETPPPPAPAEPRPEPPKAAPSRPEPARPEPTRPEAAKAEAPRAEPAKAEPAKSAPPVAPPRPAASADGEGGKAVLDRMRQETASIGGAAATAVRAMRDKLDETSEPVPAERIEPKLTPAETAKPARPETAKPDVAKPEAAKSDRRPAEPVRTEPVLGAATSVATAESAAPDTVRAAPDTARRQRPPEPPEPSGRSGRGRRVAVFAVLALLIAAAIGAVAGMQAGLVPDVLGIARQPVATAPETDAATPPDTAPPAAENGLEPKITDRLPQEGVPPAVAPDARAVPTLRVTPPLDEDSLTGESTAPPATPEAATPAPATPAPATPEPAAPEPPPAAAPETPPPETAPPPADGSTEAPATGNTATAGAAAPAVPDAAPGSETQPAVIVAQRSILYEEPVAGSEGTRLEGEAIWTFVDTPPAAGGAAEPTIRAEVSIPERGLRLALTIRKNADAALPASHLVDLAFTVEPSFTGRAIGATPGLIMKQTEDARGDPLVGAVAPVSENLFWLALSSTERDLERNLSLLKEREWIDVPIRYADRRRAILTFEKGTPGRRAFEQAMAAWGQ
ncbi:hypothetical protein [Methylobrevis albus]|uniref:CheA signal transduction histidine kinase n=1 Tax=Methylobrevis albus TaxID=2793297 RepID=A0A931I3T0_9HYPH|nr:hypothetical protein [Methylobrevis albus]MBH0239337.1 hypothetical protein [Methylobrevis albus]